MLSDVGMCVSDGFVEDVLMGDATRVRRRGAEDVARAASRMCEMCVLLFDCDWEGKSLSG